MELFMERRNKVSCRQKLSAKDLWVVAGTQNTEKIMGLFIYFCGSIRGGRQDAELYQRLIEKLKAYGDVLTEHVGNPNVDDDEEKLTDREIYERDMKWLDQCDVVVAEVTQPSLGVGIELGKAFSLGKKILCLFRPSSDKRLSALVSGAHDDEKFIVKDYKEKEVDDILKDFLGKKND